MDDFTVVNGDELLTTDLTIETAYSKYGNPNPGPDEWALYQHIVYPESSVLAGQSGRVFLDSGTKAELTLMYPNVQVCAGSSYIDPDTVQPSGKPSDYDEPWDEE